MLRDEHGGEYRIQMPDIYGSPLDSGLARIWYKASHGKIYLIMQFDPYILDKDDDSEFQTIIKKSIEAVADLRKEENEKD